MHGVKSQTTLAEAFVRLCLEQPEQRTRLRLVMVGDGPLRDAVRGILREGGVERLAWLPGDRSDVPELMRGFDVFVLPSAAEGI